MRVAHRSIEADAVHQPDWRFCHKCFALFWNGDQGGPNGCAKDHGRHEAAGYNFLLPHDIAEDPGTQTRWRFCGKCTALFFSDAGNGHCPSDNGSHAPAGFVFTLQHSTPESLDRQTNWQRCTKCSCLYFDGFPDNGSCPLDGQGHESDPVSFRFTLAHNPGEDVNTRGSFRFCLRCHGLVRTDQSSVFPWTAPTVVDNADHPLLESHAGQGLVMISYDWTNFSLSWLSLNPGARPRFDTVRYYHAGKHKWGDLRWTASAPGTPPAGCSPCTTCARSARPTRSS
jgi:hypothetical protein